MKFLLSVQICCKSSKARKVCIWMTCKLWCTVSNHLNLNFFDAAFGFRLAENRTLWQVSACVSAPALIRSYGVTDGEMLVSTRPRDFGEAFPLLTSKLGQQHPCSEWWKRRAAKMDPQRFFALGKTCTSFRFRCVSLDAVHQNAAEICHTAAMCKECF